MIGVCSAVIVRICSTSTSRAVQRSATRFYTAVQRRRLVDTFFVMPYLKIKHAYHNQAIITIANSR